LIKVHDNLLQENCPLETYTTKAVTKICIKGIVQGSKRPEEVTWMERVLWHL
jgi:hypothetical protein